MLDRELGDVSLDLVIDDASHLYEPTKASFEVLFPRVRPGGMYVIEDWNADQMARTVLRRQEASPDVERLMLTFLAVLNDPSHRLQPRLRAWWSDELRRQVQAGDGAATSLARLLADPACDFMSLGESLVAVLRELDVPPWVADLAGQSGLGGESTPLSSLVAELFDAQSRGGSAIAELRVLELMAIVVRGIAA